LNLKLGRFGAFIGCSNYPDCRYTRQLGPSDETGATEPRLLGQHPDTGEEIYLKVGRFGPYVQLGEGEKPQRASIPKGFSAETLDLERALQLLSLPRNVGTHPETAKPILAGFGRFGPYLSHDGAYASLESPEDVFTVGINRAVTLLAERKEKGGRMRGAQALKELGAASEGGPVLKVMKGRYGPYVTDGKINATLPRDADPMAVTREEAQALIAARAEKGPAKSGRGKKPAATRKQVGEGNGSTAKKAAKKPASKAGKTKQKREPSAH
jgi:DNA topoisomerase-1